MDTFIIIGLSLLFSAIFSGMEIAFVSANKMEIELESKSGSMIAGICSRFVSTPSRFLATMLIGNNLALVVYSTYMEQLLEGPVEELVTNVFLILFFQTIISTLIILILGEYIPKNIFHSSPIKALKVFALVVYPVYFLLKWVVAFTIWVSRMFLKIFFKVDVEDEPPIFDRLDLEKYLEDRTRQLDHSETVDHEIRIYKNALDLSRIKARECMVPRTELVALDVQASIPVLVKTFTDTGLSKILIYRGSIDNIVGFVHSMEMFKRPADINSMILPVFYIPETMPADQLLTAFIQKKKSIAVVVDEFGGTSGMITVEDVMEEIFGEIEDEHDTQEMIEQQITTEEYLFSARIEIDYINQHYGLELPVSDAYETLGGLIFSMHETIPQDGAHIQIGQFDFLIEKVSNTRIELVRVFVQSK
ncbi:MAG: hemolysin family protein [Bacteroidetes bacterium]|nr:hemolysin family protein [Bacteroidota bacterium]